MPPDLGPKAFILEETNLVRRPDLNTNDDRSIRRSPARCGRKDRESNFSF
jgi:hypothetical protein